MPDYASLQLSNTFDSISNGGKLGRGKFNWQVVILASHTSLHHYIITSFTKLTYVLVGSMHLPTDLFLPKLFKLSHCVVYALGI